MLLVEADERAEHAARAEAGDGERCVTVSGSGMLFFFLLRVERCH